MIIKGKELVKNELTKVYGRFDIIENKLALYYSLSGFRMNYCGLVKISIDVAFDSLKFAPYITFIVDLTKKRVKVDSKNEFIFNVKNSFEIYKSTENESTVFIEYINIDNKLKPINYKKNLLVLGDSYTCGYANLASFENEAYSSKIEDALNTYYFLSLYNYDFDFHVVAFSGISLYKSLYQDFNFTDIFNKISFSNQKSYEFKDSFDLVIVNLGANDEFYLEKNLDELDDFKNAYYRFILKLINIYKNANIVLISYDYFYNVKKIISNVALDLGLNYLELVSHFTLKEKKGTLGHPLVSTHKRWSQDLTNFLKSKNII